MPFLCKSQTGRYALVGPVNGGYAFWAINDLQRGYALVSISKNVPDARQLAKTIFIDLYSKG